MFRSSCFWFLVTFGDEVTKILRNLCLHFARQYGQEGKKRKEKWPKYQKPKEKMGWTKQKQNKIRFLTELTIIIGRVIFLFLFTFLFFRFLLRGGGRGLGLRFSIFWHCIRSTSWKFISFKLITCQQPILNSEFVKFLMIF